MIVKKVGKIVLGVDLTDAERTALNMEAQKAFAEYDRKNANEIDATFLWIMHEEFGFGYDRLKKIHESFGPKIRALCDRYEMTDSGDELWLCTHKLKDIGVDIEEWNKEVEK